MTIHTFGWESVAVEDLTSTGLLRTALEEEGPFSAARIWFYDEEGRPAPETAQMLYAPAGGQIRAGISWGGDPVWTDASDVDDAIRRYIDGVLVN